VATLNIGNLTFTHRGDYASGTAYVKNDVVYYSTNGNAYIAKQATTGNAPTNGTYWSQFAAGSGGIWNAGLALGSASQQLRVNSGGNALEFFTVAAAGSIKQIKINQGDGSQYSHNSQSYTDTGANFQTTITPTASGNKMFIWTQLAPQMSNQGRGYFNFSKSGDSSGNGDLAGSNGIFNAENITSQGNGWVCGFYMDTANSTNALTYKLRQKTSNSTSMASSVAQSHSIFMVIEVDQSKVS